MQRVLEGEERGHAYYRFGHYNGRLLEEAVADLEGAQDAVATASGMAAITATVLALAESGDHVVADRNAYGDTRDLLEADLPRRGIRTTLVDASDLAEVGRALTPNTRLLLVEALTNPTVRVPDLPALVALAGHTGTTVVVDATFATPALFRPLEHGADLVRHSIPKYLGGHSAAMGGVVAGDNDLIGKIRRSVVHPATTTHRSLPPDQLDTLGITDGLIRLSTGIEEPVDLIAELGAALASPGAEH